MHHRTHAFRNRAAAERWTAIAGSFAAFAFGVVACGRTTSLGDARSTSGGTSGTNGATSGATASDGASGAPTGGTSGFDGGGTSGLAMDGTATSSDAALPCNLPQPTPIANPTPAQLERASLVHDYCVNLARDGCLDFIGGSSFISQQTLGCSIDDQIVACEEDRLWEYAQQNIAGNCDAEWKAAIQCAANTDWTDTCGGATLGGWAVGVDLCRAEYTALNDCESRNEPWADVTGTRTTCGYGMTWNLYGSSVCYVQCQLGTNLFELECGGPEGLPLRCKCSVNGENLGDPGGWWAGPFYASNCQDAAQHAADGECVNRLDCCFEYFDGTAQQCICVSDPGLLNMPSCDAAAGSVGGTVVDICNPLTDGNNACPPGFDCTGCCTG